MVCVTDSGCSCITSSILRTNSLTGEYITGGERRGRGEGEERERRGRERRGRGEGEEREGMIIIN